MKCPECQFEVADGLKFCSQCGSRLQGGAAPAARMQNKQSAGGPSWKSFIALLILCAVAYGGFTGYMWYMVRDRRAKGIEAYNRAQFNNCITNLKYVIRKDPNSTTQERLILAKCYFQNKQPNLAMEQLKEAAVWQPDNPEINALWARLLVDMRQYDQAVEHALKALKSEPGNRRALIALGLARMNLEEYDEAAADLTRALEGASKEESQVIYNAIGQSFEKKGDIDKALDAYKQSVSVYANQEEIRMKLGVLFLQKDKFRDCYVNADAAKMLYEPGSANQQKAGRLSDTCLELMKDTELRACVMQRRQLDKQFFSYYLEYHGLDREIRAEETEHYGNTGYLEDLRTSVLTLKEDYAGLECLVDDPESNYELSRQTMRFLCERLAGTITALVSFLDDPDDDTAEMYHRAVTELEKTVDKARAIWKNEDDFYQGLDPIVPKRAQEIPPAPE
jgi:cytochrome c-type biogenesis protein CcmH/NrfG